MEERIAMFNYSSDAQESSATLRLMSLLVVVYWMALVVATHLPGDQVPQQLDPVDKFLHISAYAGLSFLILMATRIHGVSRSFAFGLLAVLIAHGMLDEWTQGFVPGRYPSVLDTAADGLGAAIGILTFIVLQPVLRRLLNQFSA